MNYDIFCRTAEMGEDVVMRIRPPRFINPELVTVSVASFDIHIHVIYFYWGYMYMCMYMCMYKYV